MTRNVLAARSAWNRRLTLSLVMLSIALASFLLLSLERMRADVRGSFERIDVATHEIAAGNLDLSGRTEAQASALEQTASSMEELASAVQQNSDSAATARCASVRDQSA